MPIFGNRKGKENRGDGKGRRGRPNPPASRGRPERDGDERGARGGAGRRGRERVPEDARGRGAALRTAARGDARPARFEAHDADDGRAPDGRTSLKKPEYANRRERGAPEAGGLPDEQTHYRPQGSLVAEPVPSASNLPPPEKLYGRKSSRMASLTAYVILMAAAAFFFLIMFLPVRYALTGGASAADEEAALTRANSEASEEARALAETFAAAYLEVDPEDGPEAHQARVTPFLSTGLPADVIALKSEGGVARRVLSTSGYRVEELREGRWAVFTESTLATTVPEEEGGEGAGEGETSQDPLGADEASAGSSFTSDGGETTVRRLGLQVFVGEDDRGNISVVAPPNVIAARTTFEGEPGAIAAEKPQALSEGPVKSLLEGYLAAAYGSDESRASISNFLSADARPPAPPAPGLEFVGLEDGVVYEAPTGSDFSQAYDVEAYVSVRDPEAGTTSTQTHVLRVGETDGGWKLAGPPGYVGR